MASPKNSCSNSRHSAKNMEDLDEMPPFETHQVTTKPPITPKERRSLSEIAHSLITIHALPGEATLLMRPPLLFIEERKPLILYKL